MRPFILACALVTAGATAAQAQSYRAVNLLTVVPLNAADFEVIEKRGEGARGLWCAAADYALSTGAARATRLYVKTARGPSVSGVGRKGVVFTLDESRLSDGPTQSYSVSVNRPGQSLPLHHAYQFCKDYQIEPDDIAFKPRVWP